MKTMMKIFLGAIVCASFVPAFAKDGGCLIQGALTANKIRQVSNYCLSNRGVSDRDFRQMCQDLFEAQGGEAGGNKADSSISMKYVDTCPGSSKGVCEGIFGHKVSLLYLSGDDSFKHVDPKQFCESSDGRWQP